MRLLLLSNSTLPGEPFFAWPRAAVAAFLDRPMTIAFVPYAAVTHPMDEYAEVVGKIFAELGHTLLPLHREADPAGAVQRADAVMVGGGNTFHLLRLLYKYDLIRAIRAKAKAGAPYVGWSAGSNVACPSIMTTNDMPIVEPPSFRALDLVPFQINPHYTEARIEGHGGESRDQRIAEFLVANPDKSVIGLREGALLKVEGHEMVLQGRGGRLFRKGADPLEIGDGAQLRVDLT
ncbi:MAG: dipeptidase PepE [Flavobacteriales bacterium]|nr:dipeptidase PepE [Flavobacteriales bacterium]